ncbi:hypothetical protein FEM48_Zijuj01G0298000 [Ziziphus jujuba var. spinosa]|uniref:Acyl-[acyl-carrier-protein] hydrolase n=1 Tax=Ziziphus jujuba var. spinosa TaxID=714518 RepID=A0A978W5U3_ZIZJJ|nr:hypothetical protein FEM48_Zijuj01G0298000 [Ziziphus jujuba var. spinosa]
MTMVEHLSVSRSFTMLLPYYSTSSAMKRRTIRCVDSSTSTSEIKPNSIPAATPLQLNLSAAESSKKIKAVEERLERFNWKSKQLDKIVEIFSGRLLECGLVFEQNFLIRSSELGADSKASIGALTNILQESALNHVKGAGILAEGFGSTPEMSRRNLIWVVYRMQIVVDSYPSWGDVIQVNTWTCASGRNGMRREWIVRDYKTGKTLLRAACVYVMMNKTTRKISKFIKEIREETKNIFMEITEPIINHEDAKKLRALDVDTADNVQAGLLPKWSDLDVNQHVKHVKYIEWILEEMLISVTVLPLAVQNKSAPRWILETHELSIMTLEFQKECGMNTSLQSLSAVANRDDHRHHNNKHNDEVELEHTIRRKVAAGFVFQQNFSIRLSELGHDAKASIGALIHILQDSALNHCKSSGIRMENFCSTPEMSRRNLMWVVYRMQIAVASYPSWADDIQIDTWMCASGKNGMIREWIVRDYKTGETLLRAVCVYVMMNKKTRKLSKFIEEIREEMQGILMDITDPIIGDEYGKNLRELDADTADIVRTGLVPTWSDLDFNQHVNHVKYINWILESAPDSILETHKLSAMTLEFWKECGMNSCLQSLSALATKDELPHRSTQNYKGVELELDHTIRLENQPQILLKGRTIWLPKTF